ncbi:polysaccharide biosynthesis tyrosine autokinase [Nocardioides sp. DS6]|uniref:non-specific protein-tyrosine kinase n=1 Tax=Nocardioides eburneus TaxID=3231482 RepID=A0ABV3SV31_9ACTN
MEITDYLKIVRRRWAWIVVTTLVCAAAAVALTLVQTKEYASSARLFVSTSNLDDASALNQAGQFSQARVQSYADLVSSRELAQQVISDLHLSTTPADLSGQVKATVATNTVNLTLTATDPDPHQAQSIAQSYAEHLTDMVRQLETPPGKKQAPIKATIVDNASYSDAAVSPKPVRNIGLGVVLGLLIGFGLAVLRQTLDTRINSTDDLAEVTEAPVLGAITFDSDATKTPLVSDIESHSPRAEAFRVLRTNLQFIDVDSAQKIFVVTSAVPNEGKTSTATNLAISLAQAGVRTLLLESDLRRPKAHAQLQLDGAVGLTNLLVGKVSFPDAVQKHDASGLEFIAAGPVPPNPAELLQSHAMQDILDQLRKEYDVVIIDAPPLLPVTDAALLASRADGALLLVRHGNVTRDQVRHSLDRLAQVDAALVGVVINGVPGRNRKYGYGYGYGYAPDTAGQVDKG